MTSPKVVQQMASALREVLYVKDHGEEIGEPLALQVARALGAYDREAKVQAAKEAIRARAKARETKATWRESLPLVECFGPEPMEVQIERWR
jgi:2-hydroxychromene-2-carboxylate isomerase